VERRIDWRGRIAAKPGIAHRLVPAVAWALLIACYVLVLPHFIVPEHRRLYVPSCTELLTSATNLGWGFVSAASATAWRASVGFLAGSAMGVLLAFVMFRYVLFGAGMSAVVEVVRPLPPVSLTLFLILWFGGSWVGPYILVALGCFMVLVVGTSAALRNIDVSLLRAARSLGARGLAYYGGVLLPAITPELLAPLRVALALAFAVTISAEFMGVQNGLGSHMIVAKPQLDTATIIVLLAALTVEAKLADWILLTALGRFAHRH
jgi:sulfonate transport system permease protein